MSDFKLIIIRHAETQNSKDRRFQSPNSAILPVAHKFVEQAKKTLLNVGTKEIWVSELDRSFQTAELLNLPTRKMDLLNEFREPTSLFNKQISASSSYILDVIDKYDDNPNYVREDGESLNEFMNRILEFRTQVENGDEELTVCVGHGFYMRLFALLTLANREKINSEMLYSALNMKVDKLNCASFIFKDRKWSMEAWNSKMSALLSQPV